MNLNFLWFHAKKCQILCFFYATGPDFISFMPVWEAKEGKTAKLSFICCKSLLVTI